LSIFIFTLLFKAQPQPADYFEAARGEFFNWFKLSLTNSKNPQSDHGFANAKGMSLTINYDE
jgi:hypothetical protein